MLIRHAHRPRATTAISAAKGSAPSPGTRPVRRFGRRRTGRSRPAAGSVGPEAAAAPRCRPRGVGSSRGSPGPDAAEARHFHLGPGAVRGARGLRAADRLLNDDKVDVSFVFFTAEISLLVLIVLCLGIGFAAGYLADRIRERRKAERLKGRGQAPDSLGDPVRRLVAVREPNRGPAGACAWREEVLSLHEGDAVLGGSGGEPHSRRAPPAGRAIRNSHRRDGSRPRRRQSASRALSASRPASRGAQRTRSRDSARTGLGG